MSNRSKKERWKRIAENKKKCCRNCSQLFKCSDGNYGCSFIEYHGQKKGSYVLIMATEIDKPHSCYDKYNGKNLA